MGGGGVGVGRRRGGRDMPQFTWLYHFLDMLYYRNMFTLILFV